MVRKVDLVSYLPEFMQKYRELIATLEAENPEFDIAWDAVDRILYNHFVSTADESGIARFEKLLGIFPTADDNLESRRLKVQTRWVNKLPYTVRVLVEKIRILSNGADFKIETDFRQGYRIVIHTMLELIGQVGELEHIVDKVIPCSIVTDTINHICGDTGGKMYIGGGIAYTDIIEIEN